MRTIELAKVAAAAEALRLRRLARRQGMRAAFGAGAAVFAIAVLVMVHVLAWHGLLLVVSPLIASLILFAVDLVAAGALAVLAMRDVPDTIEAEAKEIRARALAQARASLTMMAMAAEVAGLVTRTTIRQGARRGLSVAVSEGVARLFRR